MSVHLFINNSYAVSELITHNYSTSFSLATSLLEKDIRRGIYAIYGFVRLADEIVDSLQGFDKAFLLQKLNDDLAYALQNGISTNPVLVSFADTVKKYDISTEHIHAFMMSMKNDLTQSEYANKQELDNYIYGSADVVGLMCLKVFCYGKEDLFEHLKHPAQKLGSAFQKVNFLRDLKFDMQNLGRSYFPEISQHQFNEDNKILIEKSIESDFNEAWIGLKELPGRSKLAVGIAYFYYKSLFLKIKQKPAKQVLKQRIRISNLRKYFIIMKVTFLYKTKLI